MRNRYATQGACICVELRRRPMTYAEMLALGLSTSPWRRVREYIERTPGLKLLKGARSAGGRVLTTWRVVKA